jgi:gamma-glutamyl-gamma-aminobutyrate hydrolase PuuD
VTGAADHRSPGAEDGSIEAVEATARGRFLVGVLWHPEQDGDEPLFAALVDAAGALRAEPPGDHSGVT